MLKYEMIKTPQLVIVVVCAKLYYFQNYGAIWFILRKASSLHIPGPNRLPIETDIQNY